MEVARDLPGGTVVYIVFEVPETGFTITVTADQGLVDVCGSRTVERPDCSVSTLHDWLRQVSAFSVIYITPDGTDADSTSMVPGGGTSVRHTI